MRTMAEKKARKRPDVRRAQGGTGGRPYQGRAVRRYLEALEAHKPKRGRKRTPESIEKRLARIEDELPDADPLNRRQPHPGADGPAPTSSTRMQDEGRPDRARAGVRRGGARATASARASATRRGGRPASRPACSSRQASPARCGTERSGRQQALEQRPPVGASPAADGRPARGGASAPRRCGRRAHAGDVVERAIRVVDIAEHDPFVGLQLGQRRRSST